MPLGGGLLVNAIMIKCSRVWDVADNVI